MEEGEGALQDGRGAQERERPGRRARRDREEGGQWRGATRPGAQGFDEFVEHPRGGLLEEPTASPRPSSARLGRYAVGSGFFAPGKFDDA